MRFKEAGKGRWVTSCFWRAEPFNSGNLLYSRPGSIDNKHFWCFDSFSWFHSVQCNLANVQSKVSSITNTFQKLFISDVSTELLSTHMKHFKIYYWFVFFVNILSGSRDAPSVFTGFGISFWPIPKFNENIILYLWKTKRLAFCMFRIVFIHSYTVRNTPYSYIYLCAKSHNITVKQCNKAI